MLAFVHTEPGKMFLPALPWFIVPDLFGSDGPPLDVDAFPDLLIDELVDFRAEPTRDVLSFPGHLFELGEICQRSLPRCLRARLSKPVGRIVLDASHFRKL